MGTISREQEESARNHGVILVELAPRSLSTYYVSVNSWNGSTFLFGTIQWLNKRLSDMGIEIIKTNKNF